MTKSRAIIASYVGVLVIACPIFIAGGRLLYWQAILYLIVAMIGTTINHLLTPKGSDLTVDRATRAREGVKWDKALLGVMFLLSIITFVVAGLDSGRFKWSGEFPVPVTAAGVFLMTAGQILFALAKRVNSFFSSTVNIDAKREHVVCEKGPYGFVRHPGYLGMIISLVGFPLILNSYWTFIFVAMSVGVLVLRTYLEDGFLKARLNGYTDYALKTKWRLIPYIF